MLPKVICASQLTLLAAEAIEFVENIDAEKGDEKHMFFVGARTTCGADDLPLSVYIFMSCWCDVS